MNNVISTTTEFRDRTRVEIENLVPWDVGVQIRTISGERFNGANVPGSRYHFDGTFHKSIYRQLTLEEVITQISLENPAFCGIDGKGSHACFRICDFELYKAAFDLPDATEYPVQLTHEEIEKILKITDVKKFKARLDELVVTESEKFQLAISVANYQKIDDLPIKIVNLIEAKTERKIQ